MLFKKLASSSVFELITSLSITYFHLNIDIINYKSLPYKKKKKNQNAFLRFISTVQKKIIEEINDLNLIHIERFLKKKHIELLDENNHLKHRH